MKTKKSKKIVIITVILVLLFVLGAVGFLLLKNRNLTRGIDQKLDLGDRYLEEMDYSQAIAAYGEALSLDASNVKAMLGLANAYKGNGDNEKAYRIFAENLSGSKDPDVLRSYALLLEENGKYGGAVRLIRELIDEFDVDEDSIWYEKVLEKQLGKKYPIACNGDQILALQDGTVIAKGSNVNGALGTGKNIGTKQLQESFYEAQCPAKAGSVFTTGCVSGAVSEDGSLYLAGSNRSGQKGNGEASMLPEAGWQQSFIGKAAKLVGGESYLLLLTENGELYSTGENVLGKSSTLWNASWTQISQFGHVLDMQMDANEENVVFILNERGNLYECNVFMANPDHGSNASTVVAKDVALFASHARQYVAMNTDNVMQGRFSVALPESWETENYTTNGYTHKMPYNVLGMALLSDALFLQTSDDSIILVRDGQETVLMESSNIQNVYTTGQMCVVVDLDGSYRCFDEQGNVIGW